MRRCSPLDSGLGNCVLRCPTSCIHAVVRRNDVCCVSGGAGRPEGPRSVKTAYQLSSEAWVDVYPIDISRLLLYRFTHYLIQRLIMEQGSVFRSNRSQAVRLPKSVALPDSVQKVDVIALGNARLLVPAGQAWASWFDAPGGVSEDFMADREQPVTQAREAF